MDCASSGISLPIAKSQAALDFLAMDANKLLPQRKVMTPNTVRYFIVWNMFSSIQKYVYSKKMQASPTWNPTAAKENGKLEQLTPNLTQRTSMMRKGDRQSKVKALLTTVEGLGSGSLNKCLISGFAE